MTSNLLALVIAHLNHLYDLGRRVSVPWPDDLAEEAGWEAPQGEVCITCGHAPAEYQHMSDNVAVYWPEEWYCKKHSCSGCDYVPQEQE